MKMTEELEGTSEFNRWHRMVTGEVPTTVANSVVDMFQHEDPEEEE